MRWTRAAMVVLMFTSLGGAPTTLPSAATNAKRLADEFRLRLARSRYLAAGAGRDVAVPGWTTLPTKRYTYAVTDADGTRKTADVVLVLPSVDQIAR